MISILCLLAPLAVAATGSVCIDPGHGGSDPGAVANGINEKDVNLSAGLYSRDWLHLDTSDTSGGGSWNVYMTRDTDLYVSLAGRCDYANGLGVDLFMSIHANAGGGDGTETFAYTSGGSSDHLAHLVQEEVLSALGTYSRGVKYNSFYVLRYTNMPADLTEMVFLDTWTNNAELMTEDNLDAVGLAHLYAAQRYMGLGRYTPSSAPQEPSATVGFTWYPEAVRAERDFDVAVQYWTDLHAFGGRGQLSIDMKDGATWEVLHHQTWDNGGSGIQGPSGSREFSFQAPGDRDSVCFVSWFAPLGGGWDDRYASDSTCSTPTGVSATEEEEEATYWLDLGYLPARVTRGEEFSIEISRQGTSPGGTLNVDLIEGSTELIVNTITTSSGIATEEGTHPFTLSYSGDAHEVWLQACLADSTGRCVATADNQRAPIQVHDLTLRGAPPVGCACGTVDKPSRTALWPALLLLGVTPLLRRWRRDPTATTADRAP